jgi:hypothetical protein
VCGLLNLRRKHEEKKKELSAYRNKHMVLSANDLWYLYLENKNYSTISNGHRSRSNIGI